MTEEPFAVLANVSGNLEAMEAVLAEVDRLGLGGNILFLGDAIGHGPDPAVCLERMRERARVYLLGSIESIALRRDWSGLNPAFARMIQWTAAAVGRRLRWLRTRPLTHADPPFLAAHRNPQWPEATPTLDKLNSSDTWRGLMECEPPIVLTGGDHRPWALTPKESFESPRVNLLGVSLKEDRAVVSVGSVGMPYDEPRACFATIAGREVEWHRVAYDVEATIAKIRRNPEIEVRMTYYLLRRGL